MAKSVQKRLFDRARFQDYKGLLIYKIFKSSWLPASYKDYKNSDLKFVTLEKEFKYSFFYKQSSNLNFCLFLKDIIWSAILSVNWAFYEQFFAGRDIPRAWKIDDATTSTWRDYSRFIATWRNFGTLRGFPFLSSH